MVPMKAVRLLIGTLLRDAVALAPAADKNKTFLIAASFTPSEDLVAADLTFATFDGGQPIEGTLGAQGVGNDPITGEQIVTIKEPLGGWRYVCAVEPPFPETIYGFALLNNAGTVLLSVQAFPTPIPISAVGDEINLGKMTFRINIQPMS